ncbi:unnamed protein product [Parnassius apollo]|uniref:(apollo) hypothetical protein n=1 Tax=Parnassius apollo TaxID=110799 RepID=A0A8S3WSH3_PARAO|nr:unnamed protein product [Parnassius apollo]
MNRFQNVHEFGTTRRVLRCSRRKDCAQALCARGVQITPYSQKIAPSRRRIKVSFTFQLLQLFVATNFVLKSTGVKLKTDRRRALALFYDVFAQHTDPAITTPGPTSCDNVCIIKNIYRRHSGAATAKWGNRFVYVNHS